MSSDFWKMSQMNHVFRGGWRTALELRQLRGIDERVSGSFSVSSTAIHFEGRLRKPSMARFKIDQYPASFDLNRCHKSEGGMVAAELPAPFQLKSPIRLPTRNTYHAGNQNLWNFLKILNEKNFSTPNRVLFQPLKDSILRLIYPLGKRWWGAYGMNKRWVEHLMRQLASQRSLPGFEQYFSFIQRFVLLQI